MRLPRRFAPRKVVFWGLCAVLVFVPLPFGLTENWAIFVFEASTILLFLLYILGKRSSPKVEKANSQVSRIPILFKILLVVFMGISLIQLIPLPQGVLKILSPQTYNIYGGIFSDGMNELGEMGWRTLSFSPAISGYEVMKYVCFFLFFYLVLKYVRTRREIEIFVLILLISAVFQSVYGLTEYLGGTERIFGYKKEFGLGSATGTYINRNHFAGLLEMIFPISLGYLLVKADFFSIKKELSFKEKILWFSHERLQRSIIFGFISVLIGIGIFFSRSRSGITIFFITIFLMILILSAMRVSSSEIPAVKTDRSTETPARKQRLNRILKVVFIVTLFSVIMIGVKPILERFTPEKMSYAGRLKYVKSTVEIIKSYPLFGTGKGTFLYVYPMFDLERTSGLVEHAHNDYVEILAENGLLSGGSLIILAVGFFGYVFIRWGRRRDYFVKGIGLGCLLGMAAILIHSVTDFNMHIPANVVYFMTLSALALNTVRMKRGGPAFK